MTDNTRRGFGRTIAIATALSYTRILGANDRVRVGYIGLGVRGNGVHGSFLECRDSQTVAVCDLRDDYMDLAVNRSKSSPKKYKDYRRLLDDKDVDAVVIATPDHWHALMFVDACNAGKDIYVEKPLSLTVVEGRRMVETAERTKRVVQVGTQRRSGKFLQEAVDLVRAGGIGHVTVAKGFQIRNEWPLGIGSVPDAPPPNEWEWDQWLGPAPKVPYNRNRTYYNFRWFYNYSGGQLTNIGTHHMDMIRWCLGEEQLPVAVTALGGKYADIKDNREIPDTLEVLWELSGRTMVVFTQYNANSALANPSGAEIELRGTKGTMYFFTDRWEVVPENVAEMPIGSFTPLHGSRSGKYEASKRPATTPKSSKGSYETVFHARNFLDCIKSRRKCNCDTVTGHLSTSATLIGNIAHRTKSYLTWDFRAERFTNNATANRWLHYQYRAPYKLT